MSGPLLELAGVSHRFAIGGGWLQPARQLQALDGVKRIVKIVDILPEQASDAPST